MKRRVSLAFKIFLLTLICVTTVYYFTVWFGYKKFEKVLLKRTIKDLQYQLASIKQEIEAIHKLSKKELKKKMKAFFSVYPPTPENIKPNFDVIDGVSAVTGCSVTIFKREGDDFVRIATTLRKKDGSRAVGTYLGKTHPGYSLLIHGKPYIGIAHLSGKWIMSYYYPVKDSSGKVVGIFYMGMDVTKRINKLRKHLKSIKIGKSGYVFVLDTSESNKGTLIIHPYLEGKNIYDVKDAKGKPFIKEMIKKKEGLITYYWIKKAGDTKPRKKVAIFTTFEPWHWLIGAGLYEDDLLSAIIPVRNYMLLFATFGAVLIGLLLFIILYKSLYALKEMAKELGYVAEGDFTKLKKVRSYVRRSDEIGVIAEAVLKVEEFVKGLMQEVKNSISVLGRVTEEVEGVLKELNPLIEKQTQQANQVATASEEMSVTVSEIAQHAVNTSELAEESMNIALSGRGASEEAAGIVRKVSATAESLKESIDSLNSKIKNIGNVVDLIKEIADQTNLLALNAAIEAARAGEAGKGFAVVAEEIRHLADRTLKATKEISDTILSIQKESQASTEAMDLAVSEVNNATEAINRVKETLEQIVASFEKVKDSITHIATITEEQSKASEEISESATQFSAIAKQIEEGSFKITEQLTYIKELTQRLIDELKKLKTD